MKNYLIISKYHRFVEQELSKIIGEANNVFYYDLENSDLNNILDEMDYISLFAEQKYIICKNIKFKNQNNDSSSPIELKLSEYLQNSNPNVTLIIISNEKLDERLKITKMINKNCTIINCDSFDDNQINQKIIDYFKSNDYVCSNLCAELINQKCLGNYDLIINECEKLLIATIEAKKITEDDVNKIVCDYYGDDFFNIKDAIIKKNGYKTFMLLKNYLLNKNSIIPFLSMLANEYRLMYLVKNSKNNNDELKSKLKMKSDYPIKLAKQNSSNYYSEELLANIINLSNLDYQIKSGRIEEEIGFDLFLFDIFKGKL